MNLEVLKKRTEAAEGRVPHLYLCSRGHVTVGVGHLVKDAAVAQQLGFTPAEFAVVAAAPVGMRASGYASFTKTRMSDAAIDALLDSDVSAFIGQLKRALPEFDSLPDSVQEAVFDMAYNLGIGGLLKYHHLMDALLKQDFKACAAECHRNGISEARNNETAALFLKAA